jgi:small subunit ribosomal protein S1
MARKKNYTCFEYSDEDRKILDDLYEKNFTESFSDEGVKNGKEFDSGSTVKVQVDRISNGVAVCESRMGQSVIINLEKEIRSIRNLGYSEYDLQVGDIIDIVVLKDKNGTYFGSLSAGHEQSVKNELLKALQNNDCAFSVKVESLCNGGFMVNLSGVRCFLPGSLAAANRIMDFTSYLGRKINVMVEMYDDKRDIFVVSFKKYLKKIIGSKVQELSFTEKYKGYITGYAENLGIFVEWDDIYTGLIPNDQIADKNLTHASAGSPIEFWVSDIKNPSRVGLTLNQPSEKNKSLQEMKNISVEPGENKIYKGEVSKVKTFGVFVKLENGFNGLIEREELADSINEYSPGQEVSCSVLSVDTSTLKIQLREAKIGKSNSK